MKYRVLLYYKNTIWITVSEKNVYGVPQGSVLNRLFFSKKAQTFELTFMVAYNIQKYANNREI